MRFCEVDDREKASLVKTMELRLIEKQRELKKRCMVLRLLLMDEGEKTHKNYLRKTTKAKTDNYTCEKENPQKLLLKIKTYIAETIGGRNEVDMLGEKKSKMLGVQ